MGEEALRFGRQAFEFVEELGRLSGTNKVIESMARAFAQFGVETLILNRRPAPAQRFENLVLAKRWPDEWFQVYTEEEYVHDDPVTHFLMRTIQPFEWSETLYDAEPSPRATEILQRRRDFGFDRGFVVPNICMVTRSKSYVSMTGHTLELTDDNKSAISLMALYGLLRVRHLLSSRRHEKPRLSEREREVLTWVASGKTAWEIGEILSIAKRTVDEHAQTAFHKLGAVNRTQAVAIALRDCLIDL